MTDDALRLGGVDFVPVTANDRPAITALQEVLAAEPATWELLDGAPLRENEAALMIDDGPPGVTLTKRTMIAAGTCAIDLLLGYPDAATWYLGLILITPSARGTGSGTAILRDLFAIAKREGATKFRLAVVVENTAARRLYDRLGFSHIARRQRTAYTGAVHDVDVLELAL